MVFFFFAKSYTKVVDTLESVIHHLHTVDHLYENGSEKSYVSTEL